MAKRRLIFAVMIKKVEPNHIVFRSLVALNILLRWDTKKKGFPKNSPQQRWGMSKLKQTCEIHYALDTMKGKAKEEKYTVYADYKWETRDSKFKRRECTEEFDLTDESDHPCNIFNMVALARANLSRKKSNPHQSHKSHRTR